MASPSTISRRERFRSREERLFSVPSPPYRQGKIGVLHAPCSSGWQLPGLPVRPRPSPGRDLLRRNEVSGWAEHSLCAAWRSIAARTGRRLTAGQRPRHQLYPEHGNPDGRHADDSTCNPGRTVSACTGWRPWTGLGQCVEQGLPLLVGSLLRQDKARFVYDRGCCQSCRGTPKRR